MEINLINCFCTQGINSGNPAAIVQNFIMDTTEKQKLAKKLNMPVTVFLSENKNESHNVEFFYPDTEMPLCLHGTIGAAYLLFNNTEFKNLVFITKNGNKLLIRRERDIIQVLVSAQQAPEIIPQQTEICKMLNLKSTDQTDNRLPLGIFSVGSPKLLVPLASLESLAKLEPNFDLITKWSISNGVNGMYIYTKNPHDSIVNARGFNPKTGHNEDAATGVAAAALALSLKQNLVISQGAFIQRPSEINVSYDSPNAIWVGGKVVFISKLE